MSKKNILKDKMKEIKEIDDELFSDTSNKKEKKVSKNNSKNNNDKNRIFKEEKEDDTKLELFSDTSVDVVELNEVKSSNIIKTGTFSGMTKKEAEKKEHEVEEEIKRDEKKLQENKGKTKNTEYKVVKNNGMIDDGIIFSNELFAKDEKKFGSDKFATQRLEKITDEIIENKKKEQSRKDKITKKRIDKLSKKGIEQVEKRFSSTENSKTEGRKKLGLDVLSAILFLVIILLTYYLVYVKNIVSANLLKSIAIILEMVSIIVLECSFRLERFDFFIRGLELSGISYMYIYFLNILEHSTADTIVCRNLLIIISVYYIVKMILTKIIIKEKIYNKYIDIAEITKDNIGN